jgi:hypothetical protein
MVNLTRPLPLESYTGRDLIGWGNYERLKAGDMMQGEQGHLVQVPMLQTVARQGDRCAETAAYPFVQMGC